MLYSRCSLFFIVVTIPKSINPAVVVFIPPPVEPGEAPININTTNRKTVGSRSSAMEIVLNPAVLVVTL